MQPHENKNIEKRFILSLSLTGIILVGEIIGGIWTGSLALLSDAAHVFMDIFAMGLSYLALRVSSRPPDDRHTYGYHRMEVLAALTNGVTLILIAGGIGYEAYQRWMDPGSIRSLGMLGIAAIGLAVNVIVAFILGGQDLHHVGDEHHDESFPHKEKDLNLQGAFLHVVGDTISSVGVIVAALIIWRTGWFWVDPLASALIALIILFNAIRLTRSALHILIEGTPAGLSLKNIDHEILSVPMVSSVHDLHVWSICSGHIALSAHVVLEDGNTSVSDVTMSDIKNRLNTRFGIEHTTIQFETTPCLQFQDCDRC